METTRKNKVTKEPATDETLTETSNDIAEPKTIEITGDLTLAPQQLTAQETQPQQAQPQQERPTIKQLLIEAPELYGISPSADEIEQFKQRETVWRRKLATL